MRIHNLDFFLYKKPINAPHPPIIDKYTKKITGAFCKAKYKLFLHQHNSPALISSNSEYNRFDSCSCGAKNLNYDVLLETKEEITTKFFPDVQAFKYRDDNKVIYINAIIANFLCIHYVACHRDEINPKELARILLLTGEEIKPTPEKIQFNINFEEDRQYRQFLKKFKTQK